MKVLASEQDWEIVDDDGFIYKRARREEQAPATDVFQEVCDEVEEEEEDEQETRRRRREALLKKKEMYATELKRWEDMFRRQEELTASATPPSLPLASSESPAILLGEPGYEPYQELLDQYQELEWFIRKYSSICDQVEDMCLVLDEQLKSHSLQLPSPRQIFLETTQS